MWMEASSADRHAVYGVHEVHGLHEAYGVGAGSPGSGRAWCADRSSTGEVQCHVSYTTSPPPLQIDHHPPMLTPSCDDHTDGLHEAHGAIAAHEVSEVHAVYGMYAVHGLHEAHVTVEGLPGSGRAWCAGRTGIRPTLAPEG